MSVADQQARNEAVESRGRNLWIEAGAGTGKTTLLVARIFSLLNDPKEPTRLRDIAAITFTDKAAGELKVKIRAKIEQALAADAEQADWLRQALRDLEIAAIGTLHSFARLLLTERPMEAGIPPDPEVLDANGFNRFLQEAYDRWFDRQVAQPTEIFRWYLSQREFYERQGKWDWLWKLASKICREHDVLLDIPAASQFTLDDARNQLQAEATTLIAQAEDNCSKKDDKAYQQTADVCQAILDLPPVDDREAFFAALAQSPKINLTVGSKKAWGEESFSENKRLRGELRNSIVLLGNLANAENAWKLFALAQSFGREFEREKRARGALGFQDLLTRAVGLLRENKPVRAYFQKRYRYLLIDEFQDTDPLQVEIAAFLCEDGAQASDYRQAKLKPGKLTVVGDPKQSIYRFRRADIEVYEQTKRMVLGEGRDPLAIQVNFRCAGPIIDTVNGAFAPLMNYDPALPASPNYIPLTTGRDNFPEQAGVTLLAPDRRLNKDDPSREMEMSAIAGWIKRAVDEQWPVEDQHSHALRPLRYRDIALLFRRTTYYEIAENALREAGVPFRVEAGKTYYTRPEVAAVVQGLRALENPADSIALSQWLASDLVGLSDEALLIHVLSHPQRRLCYLDEGPEAGEEMDRLLRAMAQLHRERNRRGCLATVRGLYTLAGALPAARLLPHGEVAVANLHKVLAAAREADRAQLTFGEFAREWAEAYKEQREEADYAITEERDDCVRIMTIHKAKGLSWPAVIVPELAAKFGKPTDALSLVYRRVGQKLAFRLVKGVETESFDALQKEEDEFARAERVRLLYVAMTRARDYLLLPLFGKVGEDSKGKITAQTGFLSFLVEAGMIDDELQVIEPHGAAVETVAVDDLPLAEVPRWELPELVQKTTLAPEAKKAVAQALRERAGFPVEPPPAAAPLVFARPSAHDEKSPHLRGQADGLLMGKVFHELMERLDLADRSGWEKQVHAIAGLHRLQPRQEKLLRQWLDKLAAMPFFVKIKADNYQREAPFTWTNPDGAAYLGRIDLLIRADDGIWVVDYKTDRVPAERLAELTAYYHSQGEIYRQAVSGLLPEAGEVKMVFAFVDAGVERLL